VREVDEHRRTIGGRYVTLDTNRSGTQTGDGSIEALTSPTANHHSHSGIDQRLGRGKSEASGAGSDSGSTPRNSEVHGN
jgi:hypothetical protein